MFAYSYNNKMADIITKNRVLDDILSVNSSKY